MQSVAAFTRIPTYVRQLDSRHGTVAERQIVDKVKAFVERFYAEPISLRDVAESVGYSACHLTTLFRQATGVPVMAFIIRRRIFAARELLTHPAITIVQAYEAVGFNDRCYFTRQFVRYIGVTPGQFRSSIQHRSHGSEADIYYRELRQA